MDHRLTVKMKIKSKLVDILCPVYNKCDCIQSFIKAFMVLDKNKFNLILVNDGSTDDTCNIIYDLTNDIDNIFVVSKSNGGVSSARNVALDLSVSDYLWFCDPDDEIISSSQDDLISVLERQLFDVLVFSYLERDEAGETLYEQSERQQTFFDFSQEFNYFIPRSRRSELCTIWNKIYKRNRLYGLKFNEEISYAEDRLFNTQLFSGEGVVGFCNHLGYIYNRFDENSLSKKKNLNVVDGLLLANKVHINNLIQDEQFTDEMFWAHIMRFRAMQIEKWGLFPKIRLLISESRTYEVSLFDRRALKYLIVTVVTSMLPYKLR